MKVSKSILAKTFQFVEGEEYEIRVFLKMDGIQQYLVFEGETAGALSRDLGQLAQHLKKYQGTTAWWRIVQIFPDYKKPVVLELPHNRVNELYEEHDLHFLLYPAENYHLPERGKNLSSLITGRALNSDNLRGLQGTFSSKKSSKGKKQRKALHNFVASLLNYHSEKLQAASLNYKALEKEYEALQLLQEELSTTPK